MNRQVVLSFLLIVILFPNHTFSYPKLYDLILAKSGKKIDCGICHAHGNGPEGLMKGQIGGLDAIGLDQLMSARKAFDPGVKIKNPLLNDFGNEMVFILGRKEIIALGNQPEKLIEIYPKELDLDNDGIPDIDELMEGTLPHDPQSGNPLKLMVHNLKGSWFEILLTLIGTGFMFYGFFQLILGFHYSIKVKDQVNETESDNDEK